MLCLLVCVVVDQINCEHVRVVFCRNVSAPHGGHSRGLFGSRLPRKCV